MGSLRLDVTKDIVQGFVANGSLMDGEALQIFRDYVEGADDCETALQQLLKAHASANGDTKKITKVVATALVSRLQLPSQGASFVQLISAFNVPNIRFDPSRKAFYEDASPRSLTSTTAEDKARLFLERFHVLHHHLAHDEWFSRPVFEHLDNTGGRELTDVKALLAMVGQERSIIGFLERSGAHDSLFLKDLSGAIELTLGPQTKLSAGFLSEGCIVVAEGRLRRDRRFEVLSLGLPPIVRREESMRLTRGLNVFGGTPVAPGDRARCHDFMASNFEDRIIFLSDIWLDAQQPSLTARLDQILSVYEEIECLPSAFVLIGNFHSYPCGTTPADFAIQRSDFAALGVVLAKHRRIVAESRYIFVPGPDDPGLAVGWPRPPLPAALTAELRAALPKAEFATNPARIRYGEQEIVVSRADLHQRLSRACLVPRTEGPADEESAASSAFRDTALTVMQQMHLRPGPVRTQDVYWQLDRSLMVHPLPTALVLADAAAAADFSCAECVCVNPGSLRDGTFAAYRPATQQIEMCDADF